MTKPHPYEDVEITPSFFIAELYRLQIAAEETNVSEYRAAYLERIEFLHQAWEAQEEGQDALG